MTAVINTVPAGTKMLPGSIFDYHLILNEVSRSPMFLLDDVPRMFVAPWARLPRNYVDEDSQCTVRFHRGTSFPWTMTLIGAQSIGRFPAYTPVLPVKAVYEQATYDPVFGLGYIERIDDTTTARILAQSTASSNTAIPPVNDYQKAFEDRLSQNVMALPRPIPSSYTEQAVEQELPKSLCTRNQRSVRFTFAEPSEFYEVANNPNKQIPAKNEQFSDLNSYLDLLNQNFATMVNENTKENQQEQDGGENESENEEEKGPTSQPPYNSPKQQEDAPPNPKKRNKRNKQNKQRQQKNAPPQPQPSIQPFAETLLPYGTSQQEGSTPPEQEPVIDSTMDRNMEQQ